MVVLPKAETIQTHGIPSPFESMLHQAIHGFSFHNHELHTGGPPRNAKIGRELAVAFVASESYCCHVPCHHWRLPPPNSGTCQEAHEIEKVTFIFRLN